MLKREHGHLFYWSKYPQCADGCHGQKDEGKNDVQKIAKVDKKDLEVEQARHVC